MIIKNRKAAAIGDFDGMHLAHIKPLLPVRKILLFIA